MLTTLALKGLAFMGKEISKKAAIVGAAAGATAVAGGVAGGVALHKHNQKKKEASEAAETFFVPDEETTQEAPAATPTEEVVGRVMSDEDLDNLVKKEIESIMTSHDEITKKLTDKLDAKDKQIVDLTSKIDKLADMFNKLLDMATPSEEPKAEVIEPAQQPAPQEIQQIMPQPTVAPAPQMMQQPIPVQPQPQYNPAFQMGMIPATGVQVFNHQPAVDPAPQTEAPQQEETTPTAETTAPVEAVAEEVAEPKYTAADAATGNVSKKAAKAAAKRAKVNMPKK